MQDKVVLITGASSGIGKATATGIAALGARIIAVCRNKNRGEKARNDISKKTGNHEIDLMIADLASQQDIRKLAVIITSKYDKLDVLINNAATFTNKRKLTPEGYELTFAVNYLAPFLLTNLLLDLLKKSAPSRIVNVSSGWHHGFTIWFDNLQGEKTYNGIASYRQSKLAITLFTYELARRLEGTGVTVNCLHPGMIRTNIARGYYFFGRAWRIIPFFKSAVKGAETPVYLASDPGVEGVTGKYFYKKKVSQSSPESYDRSMQEKLWKTSLELTGLS